MSSQSSSMIAKAATAALVSALTLAACALPPPPPPRSPDAAAPTADVLAGTSWALATLGGQPPIQGTAITLNFGDDNRVSGNDGCNMFGGTYTVDGDVLKFGPLMGTLMACPEPVMKQADAFRQTLERIARFEVAGGTLTLADADAKALATFAAVSTDLAGTNWVVTNYNNGKQAVVSVLEGTELTVSFGADGRVSGSAGCNNFAGPFSQEEQPIKIGPLASTRKLCPEPAGVMEQEMQFLMALESATTYLLDGDMLTLSAADDATAVTLRRAP